MKQLNPVDYAHRCCFIPEDEFDEMFDAERHRFMGMLGEFPQICLWSA